jgi:Bardet-Biedl syndrome 7 protein
LEISTGKWYFCAQTNPHLNFRLTAINDTTIPHLLKLIEPKLLSCIQLKNDYKLLQILLDLEVEEDEECEEVLSQQYKDLLNNKAKVEELYKRGEPSQLNRIYGIITDLYIDKFKFKGANMKARIPKLIELFENYNFDEIVQYYGGKKYED